IVRNNRMAELSLIYSRANLTIRGFDHGTEIKSLLAGVGEVSVIIGHVAVDGRGAVVHVFDLDADGKAGDPAQRMCLFLAAYANREDDFFGFDLHPDGFSHVAEHLTL